MSVSKKIYIENINETEMRDLYKLTVKKHIEEDRLLNEREKTAANKLMRKETTEEIVKNLEGLKEQNTIMSNWKSYALVK